MTAQLLSRLRHRSGEVTFMSQPVPGQLPPRFHHALTLAGPIAGLRVADVGCWTGDLLRLCDQAGAASLVGVDLDGPWLPEAQRAVPGAHLVPIKCLADLPLAQIAPVDVVFFLETLEHVQRGSELANLRVLYSLIKPGGQLILSTPAAGISALADPAWLLVGHRHYRSATVTRLLRRAGFETTAICYSGDVAESVDLALFYFFKHVLRRPYRRPQLLSAGGTSLMGRRRLDSGTVWAKAAKPERAGRSVEIDTSVATRMPSRGAAGIFEPSRPGHGPESADPEARRHSLQTAARSLNSTRVALIADVFADSSGIFEGGAERHLLQLAVAMAQAGIDHCVYQTGQRTGTERVHDVEVRARAVRGRGLWRELAHQALDDGYTHLYFKYLEHVPRGLTRERVTATQHGVHWDIPYEAHALPWYYGGPLARGYLPVWRSLQLANSFAGLHRCRAVSAMDTSFLRVTQALWPDLRRRLFVTAPFCDLSSGSAGGGEPPVPLPRPLADAVAAVRAAGGCVVLVPRNLSLVRGESWLPSVVAQVVARRPALFVATGRFLGHLDTHRREAKLHMPPPSTDGKGCGLERSLVHLGGVDRAAMPSFFEAADIVLIPTFAHEGASLAAAEAMAFGKPVVATNIGGLNDTIDDGWTGVVTQPDPASIAEAVVRLAGNPGARQALGANARQKAEVCFSLAHWQESQLPFFAAAGWLTGGEET